MNFFEVHLNDSFILRFLRNYIRIRKLLKELVQDTTLYNEAYKLKSIAFSLEITTVFIFYLETKNDRKCTRAEGRRFFIAYEIS